MNRPELYFYQKLGELFYAVAASENVIGKSQYRDLTRLVEEKWSNIDNPKETFKIEALEQISLFFEWFDYESMDADDCFVSFTDYFKHHKSLFDEDQKLLILKTVQKIGSHFKSNHKNEHLMLYKLQVLFNQK